jgi:hypothetical protein
MTDLSIVAARSTTVLSVVANQNLIASKETGFKASERWRPRTRFAVISSATLMSWVVFIAIGYGISRLF